MRVQKVCSQPIPVREVRGLVGQSRPEQAVSALHVLGRWSGLRSGQGFECCRSAAEHQQISPNICITDQPCCRSKRQQEEANLNQEEKSSSYWSPLLTKLNILPLQGRSVNDDSPRDTAGTSKH